MKYSRLSATIFFIILSVIMLGWHLLDQSPADFSEQDNEAMADTIIDNVEVKKFAADGQLTHFISAEQVEHFNTSDESLLQKPYVIAYLKTDSAPWHISSERGILHQRGEHITLLDNVMLHQNASYHSTERSLLTEELQFDTKQQIAKTDKPVKLMQPGLELTAIGLLADIEKQHIQLLKKVRARYEKLL